jgi:hypothetical protein
MRRLALFATLMMAAGSARAQSTIDPGMSKAEVIAKLGKPSSEHSDGSSTYLYFRNGEERKYGMSDLVALENGKVVDAIFRSPSRKYSGKSSSPAPVSADAAIAKGGGTARKTPPRAAMPKPAAKSAPATPTKGTAAKQLPPASAKKP